MKKVLFVPMDETQRPIEILCKTLEFLPEHYVLNLPDGKQRLLPRDQVKEIRILDAK